MSFPAMLSVALTLSLLVVVAQADETPPSESNPATITEPAADAQPSASEGDITAVPATPEPTSGEVADGSSAPAAEELEEMAAEDPNPTDAQ